MDAKTAKNWRWMAPVGLTLVGLGFSVASEATLWKAASKPWLSWAALGTLGLILLNAGIAVFGDAVKRRFWHEWHAKRQNP